MAQESNHYNSRGWFFLAVGAPAVWLLTLLEYFRTGCFSCVEFLECGGQAPFDLFVVFIFSISFPVIYFWKVRPALRNTKGEDQNKH